MKIHTADNGKSREEKKDFKISTEKQIIAITEVLEKVIMGDFSHRVSPVGPDKRLETLSEMINHTINAAAEASNKLENNIQELKKTAVSREVLLSYLHNAPEMIFISRVDNLEIVEVNDRACKSYGYSREEFLEKKITDIEAGAEEAAEMKTMYDKTAIGETVEHYGTNRRNDGSEFAAHKRYIKINNVHMITDVRDITKQNQMTRRLMRSEINLRNLARHLVDIRENERLNISREIHDEFGQSLTALKIDLHGCMDHLLQSDPRTADRAKSMIQIVDHLIELAKDITARLRPGILDDLGLTAGIEWYAQEFEKRTGISTQVAGEIEGIEFREEWKVALFRIFQELLTNVARHASATEIEISTSIKDHRFTLVVGDNGRGIKPAQVSNEKSFGIMGIRERLIPLDGKVKFDSSGGKGTTVTINIPLDIPR